MQQLRELPTFDLSSYCNPYKVPSAPPGFSTQPPQQQREMSTRTVRLSPPLRRLVNGKGRHEIVRLSRLHLWISQRLGLYAARMNVPGLRKRRRQFRLLIQAPRVRFVR